MLKTYEAIFDHGQVQWIGPAPECEHARMLVVIEESIETNALSSEVGESNSGRLIDMIKGMDIESKTRLAAKFGDPSVWQREQRQERGLPGRGEQ